jgi:hypothetical protein
MVIPVLIAPRASAASESSTAQRTSSQPASANAVICCVVAGMFRVSVLHMDWTEQGAPPPMEIVPMRIWRVIFFITGYSSEKVPGKSRMTAQEEFIRAVAMSIR